MTQAPKVTKKGAGIAGGLALILAAIFAVEGGYVDHPSDPGGATNHGITERVARANGYRGDMRNLTRAQAEEIYVAQYIEGPGFLPILEQSPAVLHEIVDTGVNAGPQRAALWFQESLNHFNRGGRDYPDIAEDGEVGARTIAAYASLRRARGDALACELVVKAMDAKQAQHYMRLAAGRSSFEDFMPGWFRTRIGNVDMEGC